jgi:CBS domain containing-hemolysin-like protein
MSSGQQCAGNCSPLLASSAGNQNASFGGHGSAPSVLDQFKKAPVRLAMVIDEYGSLDGIVTQTDLLEAIAGDLPDTENEEPDIIERDDGSLLIDGMMPAHDAFDRLGFPLRSGDGDFHTIAGFALSQLGHLPQVGEHFDYEGWRFEIVDMDGRRIDKLLARRSRLPDRRARHRLAADYHLAFRC